MNSYLAVVVNEVTTSYKLVGPTTTAFLYGAVSLHSAIQSYM